MSRLAFIALFLLVVSCKSSRQQKVESVVIIMMEKTACMGTCPVYKFEVFLDKTARYHGKANVDLIGEYQTTLSEAQLEYLKNSFAEADYFTFANVYSAQLTDLPTTFLYYNNGRESLKVTDYWGAPEELKDLENQLEEFIKTLDWQKVN